MKKCGSYTVSNRLEEMLFLVAFSLGMSGVSLHLFGE